MSDKETTEAADVTQAWQASQDQQSKAKKLRLFAPLSWVVYWIAPKDGAERSSSPLVFHLCPEVSTLRGKSVNSGSVTEAYSQNAVRLTKQLKMEQRQCGLIPAE